MHPSKHRSAAFEEAALEEAGLEVAGREEPVAAEPLDDGASVPASGPALGEIEAAPVSERRLVARSGASTTLVEGGSSSRIEVRDASARLVFELDLVTGRAVLSAPGDLSLAAGGDIDIAARGAVRCRGEEVELTAGHGPRASRLALGETALRLSSRLLRLVADRAEIALADASYKGERIAAEANDVKVVATRLETAADRIFEQARSVFRTASDLHQLRAGRARTVVAGAYQVKSGHASIEADEDVKIDGKSINLG